MRVEGIGLLSLALAIGSGGHCGGRADYPPAVRREMACMVDVLKAVPGVSSPRTGFVKVALDPHSHPGPLILDRRHPKAPFVDYLWRGSKVVFLAYGDTSDTANVYFQVILNGLVTPGKEPDDLGTSNIERLWESRCGVEALSLFE